MRVFQKSIPEIKLIQLESKQVETEDQVEELDLCQLAILDENFSPDYFKSKVFYSKGKVTSFNYQFGPYRRANLISCVSGDIIIRILDIRTDSPTYGKIVVIELNGTTNEFAFIPRGFAYSIQASDDSYINIISDEAYMPDYISSIRFKDVRENYDNGFLSIDTDIPEGKVIPLGFYNDFVYGEDYYN